MNPRPMTNQEEQGEARVRRIAESRRCSGLMIGKPTGRYKSGTICMVVRGKRSKWWEVLCFGQKGHYAKDGSCAHTDEVAANLNPDVVPLDRVRLRPFGDREAKTAPYPFPENPREEAS